MRGFITILLALACAACTAPGVSASGTSDAALPRDVARFIERRDMCEHFSGEEPYDEARRAELNARLEETCTGTDAELQRLRTRYGSNKAVMARLAGYEARIE